MKRRPVRKPRREVGFASALILVDGSEIRRKVKREYEKVRRELHNARRQLDFFNREDLPRFTQWVSREFGGLLSALRETSQRIHEYDQLLFEIETDVRFFGTSPARAFERAMRRRRRQDEKSDMDEEEFHQASSESRQHGGASGAEGGQERELPPRRRKATVPKAAIGRLKELYRALARRLHPDTQAEMTAQKLDWWHQAQGAYENSDVEQLEVILGLCELEEPGASDKTGASLLQRITAQLRTSLRQLKTQLARCRRDPAWNFSRRTDRHAMARDMRSKLEHDLWLVKEELRAMEEHLAYWGAQAQRLRHHSYRRRGYPFENLEFDF